ncbi:hypothetical protein CEQ28_016775 [Hafnia alvei]|nr:hypothetical protein CEQ28_016775 [Hafnia alvei]
MQGVRNLRAVALPRAGVDTFQGKQNQLAVSHRLCLGDQKEHDIPPLRKKWSSLCILSCFSQSPLENKQSGTILSMTFQKKWSSAPV